MHIKNQKISTHYNEKFYLSQAKPSKRSANKIVPILIDIFKPESVVDVGCGLGVWVKTFYDLGVKDILGIDGIYVNQANLQIPYEKFMAMDLQSPNHIDKKFDIALCLEVCEHINETENIINFLTTLSSIIYFSAAIPGQGGNNHINEQWPEYWEKIFSAKGYKLLDIIRNRIWEDKDIEPWYCQNSFIYINEKFLNNHPLYLELIDSKFPLNVIHPELFRRFYSLEYISTRKLAKTLILRIFKWMSRKIKIST